MNVYLDYAAATPVAEEVKTAMEPFLSERFYNPSSPYLAAQNSKQALNQARKNIAHWLGAKAGEIIFTAGATEGDNLAIHGIMKNFPKSNLVISAIEHEAVNEPANNYDVRVAKVDKTGLLSLENLASQIDDKTVLISVIYANNEIGTIQPLAKIAALISEIKTKRKKSGNELPLYLHSDAVQAANYLDLHVSKLGVDLMTLSAAKIYGPKQVGCLYVKSGTHISPIISGGGQEKNLRSGTENIAGAVGFAAALDAAQSNKKDEALKAVQLRDNLQNKFLHDCDNIHVAGSTKKRLPNNLNVHFDGINSERLLMELDEKGIMVSSGAACEASDDEPSHVLLALGLSVTEAKSSLRISLGRHTTQTEIDYAGQNIVDAVERLRQN